MWFEKAAPVAQYGGAVTTLYFGLTPTDWSVIGIISGIVIGVAGLIGTQYFKWQHLKLAKERKVFGYGDEE